MAARMSLPTLSFRIVAGAQFGIEPCVRPAAIVARRNPAFLWTFLWIMYEGSLATGLPQIKMGPKIMGTETREKFAERARASGQFRGTFAVGKQHRAIVVTHEDRPDCPDQIDPTGLSRDDSSS